MRTQMSESVGPDIKTDLTLPAPEYKVCVMSDCLAFLLRPVTTPECPEVTSDQGLSLSGVVQLGDKLKEKPVQMCEET